MRALASRGFAQAVLPPHERPNVHALRALGFAGSDHDVIVGAGRDAPELLAACSSAASMWAANAATVSAVGRLRGRPRAFHAGESRHAFPSLRSNRRRRRACCARSSPMTRAFACTIRCRLHRSSATKARPTTRVSPRMRRGPASTSSSTADVGSAAAPRQPDIRRDRRAKRARRSRAATGSTRRARSSRSNARFDRQRRIPQRRDRGRRRNVPVLPRARVRRPGGGAGRA